MQLLPHTFLNFDKKIIIAAFTYFITYFTLTLIF